MPDSRRRVVITGLGIVSCLGLNQKSVTESLETRKSGVRLLLDRKKWGFQSALSGVIEGFDPKEVLDRKHRKSMPEFGVWAWSTVQQALAQAGIPPESLMGDERTGILFGNDSSAVAAVEQTDLVRENRSTRVIGSGYIFRALTSTISLNISTFLGLQGASWTISAACASGSMAVGQGADLIARGELDRVICGGAQEISWQSICSFDALGAFSQREDEPEKASRPFDQDRDGLVPSGGAATVILETASSAQARGAEIFGEVVGFGVTADGFRLSAPSGGGLYRAMAAALKKGGVSPDLIDIIYAHATSTQIGDQVEAEAIYRLFGANPKNSPSVVALKGITGHEFWMAGASQLVYALLMARAGFVAGNQNLTTLDPKMPPLYFPRQAKPSQPKYILLNASGFGGTNASLVIQPVGSSGMMP